MTGPKRNEGATTTGERVGTKATARYLRGSATKARVVLDLIRGVHVRDADAILQFTERDAARAVRKVLASAVANAQNNDSQDPDELYVSACFADEGPTLRRFRPRARGRATRIRKRTCHVTVIVSRMSDEDLEQRRQKEASRTPVAARRTRRVASSRRERVARSRQAAAAARGTRPVAHEHAHGEDEETSPEAPYGEGSAAPLEDGSGPEGFPVKGNADSMLYHTPESPFYERTKAEVYFATAEDAERAGFALPPSLQDESGDAESGDTETGDTESGDDADAGEDA